MITQRNPLKPRNLVAKYAVIHRGRKHQDKRALIGRKAKHRALAQSLEN